MSGAHKAGLNGRPEPKKVKPRISEGMRQDIEVTGWAVCPVTGKRYTRDDIE